VTDAPIPTPAELPVRWVRVNHHAPAHIAQRYYYAGYGSNLSFEQMGQRCPDADIVGAGRLRGAKLFFSRVASIKPEENADVLVGVYRLTPSDVATLDRHEGLGRVYDRVLVTPEIDGVAVRCFTYVKKTTEAGDPTDRYFRRLLHGYADWRFPERRLRRARDRAREDEAKERKTRGRWDWWSAQNGNRPATPSSSAKTTSLVTGRQIDVPRGSFKDPRHTDIGYHKGKWGVWVDSEQGTVFIPDKVQPLDKVPEYDPAIHGGETTPVPHQVSSNEQTEFWNAARGELWRKTDGVWRRVTKQ